MGRIALLALVSLLVAGLIASCGSSTREPAALAPPGVLFYGEASLSPGGDQRAAADALARKFPGSGNAGQRLRALIDQGLREEEGKLSFARDIQPWLGDRAAFFVGSPGRRGDDPPGAAFVATKDEQKALEAVQKQQGAPGTEVDYEGVKYRRFPEEDTVAGTFDGFLVTANERGFKAAVDASKGDRTLGASDRYKRALEGTPAERLGFVYIDAARAFEDVPPAGAQFLAPFRRALRDPIVATASAEDDAIDIKSQIPRSLVSAFGLAGIGGQGGDLVAQAPGDSLLAVGGAELGRQLGGVADLLASSFGGRGILEQGLRQQTGLDLERDVLRWMGDYAIFVRGSSLRSLGGAFVVESKDPAATRRAIGGLQRLIRRQGRGQVRVGRLNARGADAGFSVTARKLPQAIDVFLQNDRFVVAYGRDAARQAVRPGSTLGDNAEFSRATQSLGEGFAVNTFLSVPAALRLAEGLGASRDPDYAQVKPYLEPLGALVGAAKPGSGDRLESTLRLTVPGG